MRAAARAAVMRAPTRVVAAVVTALSYTSKFGNILKNKKTQAQTKMATTNIDLSVDMLKKSLAANGLPQYGTKDQMLARLLGGGEKKKPGPKPKGDGALPKKRKATSTSKPAMFDQAELSF